MISFKRFVLFVIFIIVLLLFGAYFLLNSRAFSEKIIPKLLAGNTGPAIVSDVKITRQAFRLSGLLTLSGVSFKVKTEEDIFLVSLDLAEIKASKLFSREKARVFIAMNGLGVDSKTFNLGGGKTNIQLMRAGAMDRGEFTAKKLNYLGFELANITGEISSEEPALNIQEVNADFYGGRLGAEILLENDAELNYSVKITLKGVDIKKLEQANKALFSNAKGIVDGDVEVSGNIKEGYKASGKIDSVSDMEVKAVLLKPLLDYIPQSQQKKELDLLLKQQGNIPLEAAEIILLNVTDDMIKTRVELKSKKFNLDIGSNLDFNIEGGFQNLINLQKRYFLKKR